MEDFIYNRVLEKLINEFSTMGGGAVGGVATPLGSGPKASSKGENIYKSNKATDKKHRSKGKKKKTYTRSVQHYLKNGGEKGRKRSFKECLQYFVGSINESRTARIKDLSKPEIIAFLNFLKSEVTEDISFSTTEKIAGQAMNVGIKGTDSGNIIYCATKDSLIQSGDDLFSSRFMRSSGTSRLLKKAFRSNFRPLSPGEKIVLGIEIIKPDRRKPDLIAYELPPEKEIAAIFSIQPQESFIQQDAKNISGNYWSRRHNANSVLQVLMPEDIPLIPDINIDQDTIDEINALIDDVNNSPTSRAKGSEFPVKAHIVRNISPRIRSLVARIFPGSNLNSDSPVEGIAVNMLSGDDNTFFKVPNQEFDSLQSVHASIVAEFKTRGYMTNIDRAGEIINHSQAEKLGFPIVLFKLVRYMNSTGNLRKNLRTFFSPKQFKRMCQNILQGLQDNDPTLIAKGLDEITPSRSIRYYTCKGKENYSNSAASGLINYVEQNNLL